VEIEIMKRKDAADKDAKEALKAKQIFEQAIPDRHECHDLEDIDKHAEHCCDDSDEWKDLPEFDEKKHL